MLRLEYGHDESRKPLFPTKNGNVRRGQGVISTEFLVAL